MLFYNITNFKVNVASDKKLQDMNEKSVGMWE